MRRVFWHIFFFIFRLFENLIFDFYCYFFTSFIFEVASDDIWNKMSWHPTLMMVCCNVDEMLDIECQLWGWYKKFNLRFITLPPPLLINGLHSSMIFMTPFLGTLGTSFTSRTQSWANSFSKLTVLTSEPQCGVKYDITLQLTRRVAFFVYRDAIDTFGWHI